MSLYLWMGEWEKIVVKKFEIIVIFADYIDSVISVVQMDRKIRFSPTFSRFAILIGIAVWMVVVSFLLRVLFFIWEYREVSLSLWDILRTVCTGLFFDIGALSFVLLFYALYLLLLPRRFIGSLFDKIFTYFSSILTLFILIFSLFAEITFWEEFSCRFNFVAVDYLIYTNEVIQNIQESYPLPLLVGGVLALTLLFVFIFHKMRLYRGAFSGKTAIGNRALYSFSVMLLAAFYGFFITNKDAEWSDNRYNSEISKNGIYSFFAEFRNNRMDYKLFYTSLQDEEAFGIVRDRLKGSGVQFLEQGNSISRDITAVVDSLGERDSSLYKRNVVVIIMESMSAEFMGEFGNRDGITPFLDTLAQHSLFFSNIYATGTRTVRGMEAITLSIPPTPGQSIVKRPENQNLYSVSNVFSARGYSCNFFYGGDGYFDNMNSFYGGNGFNIYDRSKGSILSDKIETSRYNIEDSEVSFENAWGICDEDLYAKLLKVCDERHSKGESFLNFVMTTSNHRPYTYPENRIDIPSGSGREGAVKYADYALMRLFEQAKERSWFENTVFLIVADHCASSAGKGAIDIASHHIPAFVVNLPVEYNAKVGKQCSQIDLFPTLFSLFGWSYRSNFYGADVLSDSFEERAFIATYRKLGLLKRSDVVILSDKKNEDSYIWNPADNSMSPSKMDETFLRETVSWYQTADYLFINKILQ